MGQLFPVVSMITAPFGPTPVLLFTGSVDGSLGLVGPQSMDTRLAGSVVVGVTVEAYCGTQETDTPGYSSKSGLEVETSLVGVLQQPVACHRAWFSGPDAEEPGEIVEDDNTCDVRDRTFGVAMMQVEYADG